MYNTITIRKGLDIPIGGGNYAVSRLKDVQVIDDAEQLHKSRGLLFRDSVTAMEFGSLFPFLNLLDGHP